MGIEGERGGTHGSSVVIFSGGYVGGRGVVCWRYFSLLSWEGIR